MHYSSTYALDKVFGWSGLCVEPTSLSGHLVAHRSCSVASNFVAESSSQTSFVVDATTPSSQFSGLVDSLLPTTNDPSSLGMHSLPPAMGRAAHTSAHREHRECGHHAASRRFGRRRRAALYRLPVT